MYESAVPLSAMSLLTPDQARAQLSATEPLASQPFKLGQAGLNVTYEDGWHNRELTDAAPVWLEVPDVGRFQLTRQAAWQLGSTCRVPRDYQQSIPAALMASNANWWLREGLGDREIQLLLAGTGNDQGGTSVPLAVAQTRSSVVPFSNLRFLDIVLDQIGAKYGAEARASAMVDYKFWHDLEHTGLRVIIPAAQAVIEDTGFDDDAWCLGVEFTNSLIGLKQTTVTGYLFRFICTNGDRDIAHTTGFSRRGTTPDQAYAWMTEAVDDALGGFDGIFEDVQALTKQTVLPDVTTVLKDLFRQFGIPKARAVAVTETMADTGGTITMYDLLNAVTLAANMEGIERRPADQLLAAGGHIIHSVGARCDGHLKNGCRRMLPKDWAEPPDEPVEPDEA
jgi:hypothetical protein